MLEHAQDFWPVNSCLGGKDFKMASASPLKLTIEEQVPFTPPRSLRRSLPVPTSSRDLNRSSSIESRSVSSTPGEDEVENGQENIQMNNTSINTSINRGLGGGKKVSKSLLGF